MKRLASAAIGWFHPARNGIKVLLSPSSLAQRAVGTVDLNQCAWGEERHQESGWVGLVTFPAQPNWAQPLSPGAAPLS